MRKKVIRILLATGMVGILLCGCGENADEKENDASSDTSTEADVTELEGSQEDEETTQAEDEIETEAKNSEAPTVSCETQYEYWYNDDDSVLYLYAGYDSLSVSGEGYEALSEAVSVWSDAENIEFLSYCEEMSMDAAINIDPSSDAVYTDSYDADRKISVTRASASILSLKIYDYAYLGGNHGDYTYTCKTFDANSGDALELTDILNGDDEGFYRAAEEYIISKLKSEYSDELFDDYEETVYSMWDGDPVWYLDSTGITFIFNTYEIGPYAMGETYVTCPYDEFAKYLKDEYFDYDEAAVYELTTNMDFETSQGALRISAVLNDYDMYAVSVSLDDEVLETGEFGSFSNAYLLVLSNGRSFVLLDADCMSDDYVTALYEITGGNITEMSYLDGVSLYGATIGTDSMTLSVHLDVLGTYSAYMDYSIDEAGELSQMSEIFEIPQDDEEWHLMTLVKDLPVTIDGEETTLSAGTQLRITGTDNNGTAYFKVEGTGETGSISYERGTGDDEWQLFIDGVSEYDYFDMIPYAG